MIKVSEVLATIRYLRNVTQRNATPLVLSKVIKSPLVDKSSLVDNSTQHQSELLSRPGQWWAKLYAHLGEVMTTADVDDIFKADIFLIHARSQQDQSANTHNAQVVLPRTSSGM